MERLDRAERAPRIDYLSEKLKVNFVFEEEAVAYLPHITPEDLETRREKYRVLVGIAEYRSVDSVLIKIKALIEYRDEPRFYTEDHMAVKNLNLSAIQRNIEHIQAHDAESRDHGFVGDIHTHPVLPKDFPHGQDPWQPSSYDIESIVENYEKGILKKDKPFIFGIAGPDETGQTLYAFYRLYQKDGEYIVQTVEVSE